MKRKIIIPVAVILAAALVVGAVVYFRPRSLADRIAEPDLLFVTCTTLGTSDGMAHNGTQTWENIAVTKDILDLLDEYPCRRSFPFSGSSMVPQEKLLVISVYEGIALVDTFILSDSGELTVGGTNYTMNGAGTFIGEFIELIAASN